MNYIPISDYQLVITNRPPGLTYCGHGFLPDINIEPKFSHIFVTNDHTSSRCANILAKIDTVTHVYLNDCTIFHFVALIASKQYVFSSTTTTLHFEYAHFLASAMAACQGKFSTKIHANDTETEQLFLEHLEHLAPNRMFYTPGQPQYWPGLFVTNDRDSWFPLDSTVLYDSGGLLIFNETKSEFFDNVLEESIEIGVDLFKRSFEHIIIPNATHSNIPRCKKLTLGWCNVPDSVIPQYIFTMPFSALTIYASSEDYYELWDVCLLNPQTGSLKLYGFPNWHDRNALFTLICRWHKDRHKLYPIRQLIKDFLW